MCLWEVASTEAYADAGAAVTWCHWTVVAAEIMDGASGLKWGILIVAVG